MTPEEIISAELALLAVASGMETSLQDKLFNEIGVTRGEYDAMRIKYQHILRRQQQEKEKQND